MNLTGKKVQIKTSAPGTFAGEWGVVVGQSNNAYLVAPYGDKALAVELERAGTLRLTNEGDLTMTYVPDDFWTVYDVIRAANTENPGEQALANLV